MPKNEVKLDLTNLVALRKELGKKYSTKVGILGSKDARDGGSNATIGLAHEKGVASKNLAPRSWLEMPLIEKLSGAIKEIGQDVFDGLNKKNINQFFKKLGILAEGIIQDAFDTGGFGKWKKLENSTKKKKGFDKILIESTQLRKSVSSEVVKE